MVFTGVPGVSPMRLSKSMRRNNLLILLAGRDFVPALTDLPSVGLLGSFQSPAPRCLDSLQLLLLSQNLAIWQLGEALPHEGKLGIIGAPDVFSRLLDETFVVLLDHVGRFSFVQYVGHALVMSRDKQNRRRYR
jgi:hypothetical protein